VVDSKATAGLATDGDADRFGIVDRDGTWIQPNLILALVYDYLVETRNWKMPAARSVATTQMIDAVAKSHGQTVTKLRWVSNTSASSSRRQIAMGGEESAGLTIRGHIPEKRRHSRMPVTAEMIAARALPSVNKFARCTKKLGREFWPVRENLHLSDEQKANAVKRVAVDASTIADEKSYPLTAPMEQNLYSKTVRGCCCVFPARNRCFAFTSKPKAPPLPQN